MRIIVLGAGAIGSLYGAKLARTNDVTLVARPDHVSAIQRDGLRIEGIEAQTVRVDATIRVEKLEPGTLILLATKVPATEAALGPVRQLIRHDTTVVSLQNGLNSEAIARKALRGKSVVLRAISQFGAILERAGVIRYTARGYTLLENHERSPRIAAVLDAAGLDCRIPGDMTIEVWRKLVFNCVVNPSTTIIGSKVGEIVDPRLTRLKQLVIDECLAVAAKEGVLLGANLMAEINAAYAGSPNIVSMQQDLLHRRVTEIDYLNGAVAALGETHGVNCPINDALTRIIKGMEDTSRNIESVEFARNERETAATNAETPADIHPAKD
jgi:2-dehydropantoate 2-reductase